MSRYYLMSQLPSLDGLSENAPVPITEERFNELCFDLLGKKIYEELSDLSLVPPRTDEQKHSAFIEAWNDGERNLRLALAKVRAEKMKKSFDVEKQSLPVELVKVAATSVEMDDPLAAERYLNNYRMSFLESLKPMDNFSEDYVFYYGIKLKLILRERQFNADAGETAYRNIYTSIMNGEWLEDKQ